MRPNEIETIQMS